jgi:hypothetical protein
MKLLQPLLSLFLALSFTVFPSYAQTDEIITPEPIAIPTADPDADEDLSEGGQDLEAGEDSPEEEPEAASKRALGGRNISAFTRNLLGNTTIGGYFDTEYYFPTGKNAFFDQHRLILQVSSFLHERMFFNTEIEFEHGGLLGAGTNDGQLKIEQVYLDYQIEDWLILRSGVILVPVGRLNVLHDSDFRDTTVRPLFTSVIVPSTWMEPGAGFYGTFFPNDEWEMSYELYVMQGLTDQLVDGNGLRAARPSLSSDNNNSKAVTGRLALSPFIGLDMGIGGYFSALDAQATKNLSMVVGDFNYVNGPWEVVGEGGVVLHDPISRFDAQGRENILKGPMWGYYVEGHYHLFPDFLKDTFLGNGFDRPVFTLFARLSQVDTDASVLNINDRSHLTFGLNYRPTNNTVFKAEYQWSIETEALLKGDPSKEIANDQFVASVAVGF